MKTLNKLATLFVLAAALCFGQTTITSTTLSANLTATATVFGIASATGVTGLGSLGQYTTMIYIDHELMGVRSVSSTTVTVDRGRGAASLESSQTTHRAAAVVWIGPPVAFTAQQPTAGSQCVRTALQYVPVIVVPTGSKWDCLGLTTAGQMVRTDAPGQLTLGAIVASPAGVLTPSGTVFHVSGTNAVTGITVPAGFAPGMSIYVIPDAAFTWTTATNISLLGTAVANKTIIFTWDGSKWNPSVVA